MVNIVPLLNLSFMAVKVALSSFKELESALRATSASIIELSSSTISSTFILPSVIVPVLSRHKTLTLASVSIEYIS